VLAKHLQKKHLNEPGRIRFIGNANALLLRGWLMQGYIGEAIKSRYVNGEIQAVSDGARYVTLILAEIDVKERRLHFINCGHNPALVLRSKTGSLSRINSN
jgi:hypothetical protein